MAGPLAGVKILDLTTVVMGPFATQILAELGAEVIKVESRDGDNMRHVGPMKSPGMGHLFLHLNRGKRDVVLDLKQPAAKAAVLRLVKSADVVVHNNRPQVMTKLGLDYPALKAVNPKLIYCGTYGYGKDGPYGERGALDDSIQAVSGIAMLNEMVLGEPRYLPTVVCDKTTAMQVVR